MDIFLDALKKSVQHLQTVDKIFSRMDHPNKKEYRKIKKRGIRKYFTTIITYYNIDNFPYFTIPDLDESDPEDADRIKKWQSIEDEFIDILIVKHKLKIFYY